MTDIIEVFDREIFDIIVLTLRMTFLSTIISSIIGIPLGLWLEASKIGKKGKKLIVTINRTLMAVPPVVVGLVVHLLFMRNGFFGFLRLLFTFEVMVIAQTIIITPIICGMVYTAASRSAPNIRYFAITMGANKLQTKMLIVKELSDEIYFAIIAGFGRAMSEVGAIMIVGGNIRNQTRTMTTAISLLRNRGEINQAILLGVTLLIIVFIIQIIGNLLRKKERENENF